MSNVRIGVLSGQQFGTLIPHVVEVYYEVAIPFCIQLVAAAEPHRRIAFLPFCKITLKAAKPMPYLQEPETLGDHLKKRRYELSLFQKEVALRLSVNDWTICNWENSKTTPAVRYLPRIIEFLGYDPFPPPQCFREEIAAARRRLGISRKRLAKKLGMDEATLARIEQGTSEPRGRHLIMLTEFVSAGYETG